MEDLVALIAAENDPAKFTSLLRQLNDLLESKGGRLPVEYRDDAGRPQRTGRVEQEAR